MQKSLLPGGTGAPLAFPQETQNSELFSFPQPQSHVSVPSAVAGSLVPADGVGDLNPYPLGTTSPGVSACSIIFCAASALRLYNTLFSPHSISQMVSNVPKST